jgi:hypothetical protein
MFYFLRKRTYFNGKYFIFLLLISIINMSRDKEFKYVSIIVVILVYIINIYIFYNKKLFQFFIINVKCL